MQIENNEDNKYVTTQIQISYDIIEETKPK